MNNRQKIVQEQFLNDEEKVIKRLKQVYNQSLKDISGKISNLDSSIAMLQKALNSVGEDEIGDLALAVLGSKKQFTPEEAKETLQSMIQSKVYQKNYQTALQKQVGGIMDTMQDKEFTVVSDYLNECYENGFVGAMYDIQGQGIPMCFPLDQEAMVRAVQLDSKISKGLYTRLGEDIALLKKKITAQVSRGISTGMSYKQVAQQLEGYTNIGFNNAVRIARTEGHRVQVQSAMDACYKAKNKGADVVKQWDAALDSRTRESHAMVDGEIRELDEKFSNGLLFPGDPNGGAAEVINCRCALLQRAKWALDEAELETLKKRAEYFGLDKSQNFEDYKKKYLKAADELSDVEEIKDAIDFAYGNYSDDDYIKWMDAYDKHNSGVHLSAEELKIIDDYTEGAYISLNGVSRKMDDYLLQKGYTTDDLARIRKNADVLEDALSKYDLDTDIVTHRFERDVSWLTGKGNDIADLEALVGKEYTAKGFTSSGMYPNRFRFTGRKADAVHFEIVTPKGTNGAFLSMSKKGENEFLYNRNTRFKILDGGERVVKEHKLNYRTMQMEEVEITERFLKVQVIPDELTNIVKGDIISSAKFVPATTLKEATERMSNALGVKTVSMGRMPIELANQYLEGTEKFMNDFPMLKGYYGKVGTKTGNAATMGVNKLSGEYIENGTKLKLSCELHLKSTRNLDVMLADYADSVARGESYVNASPFATAIHELIHGVDSAITFKKYGGFDENGLGIITAKDWSFAKAGVSHKIISQVRKEMFGAQYGKDVADATRYLGSYARSSSQEELAEAISYEYVNESNPYGARIFELFKEYVKGAFGT